MSEGTKDKFYLTKRVVGILYNSSLEVNPEIFIVTTNFPPRFNEFSQYSELFLIIPNKYLKWCRAVSKKPE